ncbi:hypothetical protein O9929_12700 [Vibrio lentus]|nr:hypothetical protein [Vibrio lentus]
MPVSSRKPVAGDGAPMSINVIKAGWWCAWWHWFDYSTGVSHMCRFSERSSVPLNGKT